MSLLAALFTAGAAEAQYFGRNKVHYDRLDFRVLQTEHFDIYYYAEEEDATRHAARMAERWYSRFSRLFEHTFTQRQPLVLYASHPHFSQTNVTPAMPTEGTGGLTERTKSRIAMPFAAGLGETDHVLGHEIGHAFQIDIAKRAKHDAFMLPGWFIEGMAEYLSLGPANPHTDMWVRDAALDDRLPTLDQLDDPRFFPYRFGHAFWSFLATQYGDNILGRMLRARRGSVIERLEEATGIGSDALTEAWHASITDAIETVGQAPPATGEAPTAMRQLGRLALAPSLSPDGRRLMFVSERDRVSLAVFMADAATGAVTRRIVSTATDPHFDSLQYIHSAGAWDETGERFAMIAVGEGRPVLVIIDVNDEERRTEIRLEDLGEAYNPSWSPDGTQIVFSGLHGGLSDLFVYTLATGHLRQLTADVYADLHPSWSPDGREIALVTDRFTSDADSLKFGPLRLAILELNSGLIRPALPESTAAKQVSPQWAPDGRSLYFISDRSGVSNVYRVTVETGELSQLTNVAGGVSGITSTSPALAVAAKTGALAFSVYRGGQYEIQLLDASSAAAGLPVDTDAPARAGSVTTVTAMLADPHEGLPGTETFTVSGYVDRLRLESIAPPIVGASTGNGFGGMVRASFGMAFADMLRDRQMQALFRIGSDAEDFAAQLAYTNRKDQWNWGVTAGYAPSRFVGARRTLERDGDLVIRETANLQYSNQWASLTAHYHLSRTRRIEIGAGLRRTGFAWETLTRVLDVVERKTVSSERDETSGRPIYVTEGDLAFVRDTSIAGPTSPVMGERMRLSIAPGLGSLTFADVRFDVRRYFMPVRPVTFAVRMEHNGRYGPDAGDDRLPPLILGLETLARGYTLRNFLARECGASMECSPIDELSGGRMALLNLEARAPLLGLLTGDMRYGGIPVEVFAFADAAFLWTSQQDGTRESDRFRSVGAGGRVNVGGFVFEASGVRPFDRPGAGWTFSMLMRPGF